MSTLAARRRLSSVFDHIEYCDMCDNPNEHVLCRCYSTPGTKKDLYNSTIISTKVYKFKRSSIRSKRREVNCFYHHFLTYI